MRKTVCLHLTTVIAVGLIPSYGNSQTAVLEIENNIILAEIARTNEEHERGLMFRKNLGENEGMLFVYNRERTVCMWMKNTFIPLTVLFIVLLDYLLIVLKSFLNGYLLTFHIIMKQ